MRDHRRPTMMNVHSDDGDDQPLDAASDVTAFTERCATGRLLAFASDPASNVVAVSPALSEALGGPLDGDRLARMMGGDGKAEPLPVVSILQPQRRQPGGLPERSPRRPHLRGCSGASPRPTA